MRQKEMYESFSVDSSRNEYFILEYYTLTEGEHIRVDDHGKAVISFAVSGLTGQMISNSFSEGGKTEETYEQDETGCLRLQCFVCSRRIFYQR